MYLIIHCSSYVLLEKLHWKKTVMLRTFVHQSGFINILIKIGCGIVYLCCRQSNLVPPHEHSPD